MIYVDERTGSVELATQFQSHRAKPAIALKRLPAADFCFSGYGPNGPAMIGVERKTVKDMLSSIRTGRFAGEQLPKLLEHYEFPFLVLEGVIRTNYQTGALEELWGRGWGPVKLGQQTFLALELESFLTTIELRTAVRVHRTSDQKGTVEDVIALTHYFSKPWERHHAHFALHVPPEAATIGKASTVRRVAFALNGIGWDRSAMVAEKFCSVAQMICLNPEKCVEEGYARPARDWQKLDGFGKVLSRKVWSELHGDGGGGID